MERFTSSGELTTSGATVTEPADLLPRVRQWNEDLGRASDPFEDAVVVIVDDNPANVVLLERVLRGAGVSAVHGVMDPREAVEQCLTLDADLVMLDLHMPHLDGFAVMSALRAVLAPGDFLPVVVLTADTNVEIRERALGSGANDFLTKPFDRVEVIQRARNQLETRALYRAVQRERRRLQAQLDAQAEAQQQLDAQRDREREQVTGVLRGGGPRMVFQPIVDLSTDHPVGVEALARFDGEPTRPPDAWFAMAAGVAMGVELEKAAIEAAMAAARGLPTQMLLSVNAAPSTVTDAGFLDLMTRSAVPKLVLELTEHDRIADYPALLGAIDALRQRGIKIAVDDAGAGYAGLRQILRLRPEIIKLDTDLTRDIDSDPARRALSASMVAFAAETGAVIIAEGIETAAELDTLRTLGVQWGQGYHLARPATDIPIPSGQQPS